MGSLIISNAVSLNGAFEAPSPPPDGWLVLDPGWMAAALEMWQAADAMVMGRKTYEGLAAVWPSGRRFPARSVREPVNKYAEVRAPHHPRATDLERHANRRRPAESLNCSERHHGKPHRYGAGESPPPFTRSVESAIRSEP